ncbi:MAG: aminomethyl transferase family protein [Clostridiales bacterium]|jgi:glycine cleavage system aminomethyltransferase T|nr:aminomethyl transferase family protein [Clostridiales bacterium]
MDEKSKTSGLMMYPCHPWHPFDPQVLDYCGGHGPHLHVNSFDDWKIENNSWKESCYIFAGLNVTPTGCISGPDAIRLLSDCTCNSHARFPVGRIKHDVMTDENGLILMHGLSLRVAEDKVWLSTTYPWVVNVALKGGYDVKCEDTSQSDFNLQCAGPRVLEALENATQEDLHDISFMGFRDSSILGKPVRIMRMGMGGTLSYEVHGDSQFAPGIYSAVLEAGKPVGMKRIGWRAYMSNHTENGYPQENFHFPSVCREHPDVMEGLAKQGYNIHIWPGQVNCKGSSGTDLSKRYRNPIELGWDISVGFDHDFPGKEALKALKANPVRRTATLIWNPEDILDVAASRYNKDEAPYKEIPCPVTTSGNAGMEQDDVYDSEGNLIGSSTGLVYTMFSRETISLGVLDVKFCEPGSQVNILWGEPGTRQKTIRAAVAKFPRLALTPNSKFDVETIPHFQKK